MSDNHIDAEQTIEQIITDRVARELKSLKGISKLISGSFTDNIANTILGRESSVPGIWLDKNNDQFVIGIRIRVYYGINIPQLSYDIQSKIKQSLSEYQEVIKSINISVEGIDRAGEDDE